MAKNLVIVESPAKAKTIEKYLGPDYTVVASFGHIRDLPKTGMSIDIADGFKPNYVVSPDKQKTVTSLKKLAKTADTVWLASDEDREGEAIAWHVAAVLGLDPKKTKRIVFHEITKPAILAAIKSPRHINQNLVDAQQGRRVLDRLVGYELSPVLWKKVRTGLSAGRVQSVAVRIIADREKEIEAFQTKSQFRVTAELVTTTGKQVKAERSGRLATEKDALGYLESVTNTTPTVQGLTTKPASKTPAAPFTTSTLQQEASRKLGFSVRQTMTVAQKLYEAGAITYMRTDSLNLSELAITAATKEVSRDFGPQFVKVRHYRTKTAGAQEAHEAIRPTDFGARTFAGDSGQKRLYELIWKRAIASQMADAQLERTEAVIELLPTGERLVARGEVVTFEGFLAVYLEGADEEELEEQGLLPSLVPGQTLALGVIKASETFDRPKPRYSEASLVKRLEEMGIGRP
jgi:DNA topoisomerase I